MPIRQMAIAAAFAAGLAAVPVSAAQAQYYPPCSPFPLFWPFCAGGALVGAAATIVTAPFWRSRERRPITMLLWAAPISLLLPITRRNITRRRRELTRRPPATHLNRLTSDQEATSPDN
jgi:hypothetical protein